MTTIHKTLTRWAFLQLFTRATAGVVAAAHVGRVYAAPGIVPYSGSCGVGLL